MHFCATRFENIFNFLIIPLQVVVEVTSQMSSIYFPSQPPEILSCVSFLNLCRETSSDKQNKAFETNKGKRKFLFSSNYHAINGTPESPSVRKLQCTYCCPLESHMLSEDISVCRIALVLREPRPASSMWSRIKISPRILRRSQCKSEVRFITLFACQQPRE